MKQNLLESTLFFIFCAVIVIMFSIIISILEKKDTTIYGNNKPIFIDSVEKNDLLSAYLQIKEEVVKNKHAIVYVGGNGGVINDAIMFYDLMHATNIWERTTFIATGQICSASNIVWLSAKNRIITPGSSFLIHKARWMKKECKKIIEKDKKNIIENTYDIVLSATSKYESALFWQKVLKGDENGTVLNAKEAIKMGWATNIM